MAFTPFLPWMVISALLGLTFGSFGSVLIARIPAGQSILGRSRCPHCRHTLRAIELIPIVSYLLQRGRCRHCKRPISPRYILIELAGAGIFVLAFLVSQQVLPTFLLALILWLLLLVSLTDARTRTIPDALSVPLILLAAAYTITQRNFDTIGMLIPPLFFATQWVVSRGRWVGSGDILLAAAGGFLVGSWQSSLLLLGIAYIAGALVASVLLLRGTANRKSTIAFGPFLALATVIVLFFGNQIMGFLLRKS